MAGYTRLFGSIIHSTVWREPHTTRVVWITMLAMADRYGNIEASIPGLADAARVTIDECKEALDTFLSPDPYSRSEDEDGRRIRIIDRGWQLINHAKYRDALTEDAKRQAATERKRRQRERDADVTQGVTVSRVTGVTKRDCHDPSPSPDPSPDPSLSIRSDLDQNDEILPTLAAVESAGFERYNSLTGSAIPLLRKLLPIYRHELDAAFSTKGRSWNYAAKVIASYRENDSQPSPPPGGPSESQPRGRGWTPYVPED